MCSSFIFFLQLSLNVSLVSFLMILFPWRHFSIWFDWGPYWEERETLDHFVLAASVSHWRESIFSDASSSSNLKSLDSSTCFNFVLQAQWVVGRHDSSSFCWCYFPSARVVWVPFYQTSRWYYSASSSAPFSSTMLVRNDASLLILFLFFDVHPFILIFF